MHKNYKWDIVVFAVNEAETIERCLLSIDYGCVGHEARVTVLLNGTTDNSEEIINTLRLKHASLSVQRFPVADKAHALNQFLYELRRPAEVYFSVDGYTTVGDGALYSMATALAADPHALIASAIPTNGRSAWATEQAILKGGVVSGQLYAVRGKFVDRVVSAGLRLPVKIYRGDPLLASMAAHDLDATGTTWDTSRIIGVPTARFEISPLSPFRWRDLLRQYRREVRQARGRMETAAIKEIIYAGGFASLPSDADEMIRSWLRSNRPKPRSLRDAYFTWRAIKQLSR